MLHSDTIQNIIHISISVLLNEQLISPEKELQIKQLLNATAFTVFPEDACSVSRCIIHPPELQQNKLLYDHVTIQLGSHSDPEWEKYILYHEISHFLSIGSLHRVNHTTFVRPWGICSTTYRLAENSLFAFRDESYAKQNENINDCLACFLFDKIEKKSPRTNFLMKRGQFVNYDQIELIRLYLSNVLPSFLP